MDVPCGGLSVRQEVEHAMALEVDEDSHRRLGVVGFGDRDRRRLEHLRRA